MNADEVLEKHLLLMLKRTKQSYASVEEMKEIPEWKTTIDAMIEFAKLHVEAASKAAYNKALLRIKAYNHKKEDYHKEKILTSDIEEPKLKNWVVIDSTSILTSYPLENIK